MPTDFDSFVASQRQLVSDLYDGKLLSDTSAEKDTFKEEHIPTLEELEREYKEVDEHDIPMDSMIDELLNEEKEDESD